MKNPISPPVFIRIHRCLKILPILVLPWALSAQTTVTNTTYTNGQNVTVSDATSVGTSGTVTVSSGANITFASGGTITLSPGFSVAAGGIFHTYVNTDSDGDGMSDYWEITHGLNPAANDAAGDIDSDGLTNLTEFLLGTNASVSESTSSGNSSIDLKINQPN